MLTHPYLLPYTMFLMRKLFPSCHIAITGFEVQADRHMFFARANTYLMERETSLRAGPKQKKKKHQDQTVGRGLSL